jgi:hypothetical protein
MRTVITLVVIALCNVACEERAVAAVSARAAHQLVAAAREAPRQVIVITEDMPGYRGRIVLRPSTRFARSGQAGL